MKPTTPTTATIDLCSLLPDPDNVGTAHYRTITDYLADVADFNAECPDDDDDEATLGKAEHVLEMLQCLEDEVSGLVACLQHEIKQARKGGG